MSSNFWIVETLRLHQFPHYGYHWHSMFSLSRPVESEHLKIVAGPFSSDDRAVDWINQNFEFQPKPNPNKEDVNGF